MEEKQIEQVLIDAGYFPNESYIVSHDEFKQVINAAIEQASHLTLINEGNIEQASQPHSLTLTARQMRDALKFCNPDGPDDNDQMDDDVVIEWRDAFKDDDGNEHPAGLYAYMAEYPEEGFYGPLM